jgi:hypothetical protein
MPPLIHTWKDAVLVLLCGVLVPTLLWWLWGCC